MPSHADRGQEPVLDLLYGWQPARALMAAHSLGLFRLLGRRHLGAASLARRAGLHPTATERLLDACVAAGILHKSRGRYWNTQAALDALLPDSPSYLGDAVALADGLWDQWGGLAEAIQAYTPPASRSGPPPSDAALHDYVLANQQRARRDAEPLACALDLRGRRSLLDLGCGPGAYAELLVRRTPGLRATLLDLGPVLAVAKRELASSSVRRRLRFLARDALRDPLGSGYDVVLVSHVLHTLGERHCRALLSRAFDALQPGGLLAVHEGLAQEEGTWPPHTAFFSLQMLLNGQDGRAYSAPELEGWLHDSGFTRVATRLLAPPAETALTTGLKPLLLAPLGPLSSACSLI